MRRRTLAAFLLAPLLAACRTGRDYPDPARYAGAAAPAAARPGAGDRLRVVSFNVEFSRRVDSAIVALTADSVARDADLVLLQEMTPDAARRIAGALGMAWVYYPAIHHRRQRRDVGNAVLSRWPIVDDARLVLPHPSRYAGTHRTATAATIALGDGTRVRVYSTHLGTPLDVGAGARRRQLAAIVDDAARWDRVVIGGDMNSADVGAVACERGYAWPTAQGPRTTRLGRWDHVFLRGFGGEVTAGTVLDGRGSSDHLPVWAEAPLR